MLFNRQQKAAVTACCLLIGAMAAPLSRMTASSRLSALLEVDAIKAATKVDIANARWHAAGGLKRTKALVDATSSSVKTLVGDNDEGLVVVVPLDVASSGTLPLFYGGSVTVGTPGTTFFIDFDTGSGDLWVLYTGSGSNHTTLYDPDASSTSRNLFTPFDDKYGSEEVAGAVFADNVLLGDQNIGDTFMVRGQPLGVVTAFTSQVDNTLSPDGLMGLGLPAVSGFGQLSYMDNAVNSGKLKYSAFSIYMGRPRDAGATADTEGYIKNVGQLVIGDYDQSKFTGELNFVDVVYDAYWEVTADGFYVNGRPVPATATYAMIDSGTTALYIPTEVAVALFDSVDGAKSLGQGAFAVPCNTRDIISVSLGGVTYDLNMADLIIGPLEEAPSMCQSLISAQDMTDPLGNPLAIFGDAFMQSVYTVFNFEGTGSVGFAPAITTLPTNGATNSTDTTNS